jgi:hypothetical protein
MADQPNIFSMPSGDNMMGGGGFMMGALMGRLLFNQNGDNNNQNSDRSAIESAVASALAQNNQANNNAMLLLKDIQDSSQGVIAAVTAGSNAATIATLNSEIANLQGQGNITTAIADSKYSIANEVHEVGSEVIASATANTAQLAATMNTLASNLQAGHAEIKSAIAEAKYDNTIVTMAEAEKTRTALAAVAALLPTQAYLDLERQLLAEQSNHRHTQTRQIVDSGNTTVTNNISQAVAVSQTQNTLLNAVEALRRDLQVNTQSTIAIGSTLGNAAQTATNVRQ